MLRDQSGLRVPLPAEAGFTWSWVSSGTAPTPLSLASAPDVPTYGYSPQQLLEGWLDLIPTPTADRPCRREPAVSLTDVPFGVAVTNAATGDSILQTGVKNTLTIAAREQQRAPTSR